MSLPIVLRAEAEAEFDEAFDWYDGGLTPIGSRFSPFSTPAAIHREEPYFSRTCTHFLAGGPSTVM